MKQSTETLVEPFRSQGLKITPQRRKIFEMPSQDDSHPTAEEIYERLAATMPDLSRTTVYKTLRELVAQGALAQVQDLTAGGIRYETNTLQHDHLFCMSCHALADIGQDLEGLDLTPEDTAGYRIVKHQVIVYGYCPNCQKS